MTIESNKAIVRRVIEEVFLRGDAKAVEKLVAPDFTPHDWGANARGREAMLGAIRRTSAGLSDAKMTIEDMIAEGDRVAVRLTSSATQSGEFMGMPPTGGALRDSGDPHLPDPRRPGRRALAPARHDGHAATAQGRRRRGGRIRLTHAGETSITIPFHAPRPAGTWSAFRGL